MLSFWKPSFSIQCALGYQFRTFYPLFKHQILKLFYGLNMVFSICMLDCSFCEQPCILVFFLFFWQLTFSPFFPPLSWTTFYRSFCSFISAPAINIVLSADLILLRLLPATINTGRTSNSISISSQYRLNRSATGFLFLYIYSIHFSLLILIFNTKMSTSLLV